MFNFDLNGFINDITTGNTKPPLTTEGKLEQTLYEHGMFENQAKQVVELAKPVIDNQVKDYQITWDRPASEYEDIIHASIFNMTKPIAYQWCEDNLPKAWFKELFK